MNRGGMNKLGCWVAAGAALALLACSCEGGKPAATAAGGTIDQKRWPADDRSLCNRFVHWRNNPEFETSETVGPGSIRPNVRRVYRTMGEHENRHNVLVCREIDTNLDGIKDLVRTFNDKGEPLHEEGDTNYDGKIDVWVNFNDGRIVEEDSDTTRAAGRPNVWKFYVEGQLSRIRRNTHCPSGQPDTWEIYFHDRLERVGNDISCDGHVDRWDRDAQLLAAEDAAQERANQQSADAGTGSGPTTVGANGEITDGGPPANATKRAPR